MANIKITDLDAYADPKSTDVLPAVDVTNDETKKVSIADLMENAGSGTEALPGIAFDGDPNTGIYRPGADQLAISTAGTQRLLISDTGAVTIPGDLTVQGTTTTIDTTNLIVEDKNIEMGSVATPTDTTADGGGITLKGATDKTINWVNATDAWTSSERFDFPAGTEGAPSIILNGDVNSGIYQPGADQVAISTNGTVRLFVDADGNVGIENSDPGGQLHVGDALSYYDTGANTIFADDGTHQRFVLAAGGSFVTDIQFRRTGDTENKGIIRYDANNNMRLYTNGSERLRITSTGEFEFIGAGTAGTDQAVYFSGSAPVDSLVVDSDGRLGLGVSSPESILHLAATGDPKLLIEATGTAVSDDAQLVLKTTNGEFLIQNDRSLGTSGVLTFNGNTTDNLCIDHATGNVGIGTTAPLTTLECRGQFSISNNANSYWVLDRDDSDGRFKLLDSSTSTNERLAVDTSGRLLVGATLARANFQNSTGTAALQVEGTTQATSVLSVTRNSATFGPIIRLARSAGTAIGSNTILTSADPEIGRINFEGNDGSEFVVGARISAEVDGEPGANDMPGRLVFATTASSGTTPTERTGISANGNLAVDTDTLFVDAVNNRVGVGTTSPEQLLHVRDDGTDPAYLRLDATGNNTINKELGGIEQFNRDTTGASPTVVGRVQFRAASDAAGAGGQIYFQTHDNSGSEQAEPTTRMVIDEDGNVGIGTENPSELITGRGNIFLETNSTSADSGAGVFWQSTTNGWTTSSAHAAIYGRRVDANNGYLRFDTRSGGTTAERARIDSDGRLLVGTNSNRTVYSGNTNGNIQVEGAGEGYNTSLSLTHNQGTGTNIFLRAPIISLARTRGSDAGSNAVVQDGDVLGYIAFEGADGTNVERAAEIRAVVDGTPGDNDMPGSLEFRTTPTSSTTPTPRMTIKADGNVGIGTQEPSTPLHVESSSGTQLTLARTGTTSDYSLEILRGARDSQGIFTDGTGISLRAEDATNGVTSIGLLGGNVNSNSIDRINFTVNGSERLRITSNGTLRLYNSPGIDFSQIQGAPDAGTSTSEVLDSYEEGTWTPTASSNMGTVTNANGNYVKVGNVVTVNYYFSTTSVSTTENSQIEGLPFNVESNITGSSVVATGVAFEDNRIYMHFAAGGTDNITIETDRPIQGSTNGTSQNIRGSVTYITA